ncbi:response regulator [Pedobacter sp. SL55]|uniref:response regulator n=1 Tax=Pedobacter sp. SL55 TaxID=2995161 RepID=UPI00226EEC80|nr:response regulator transcription factor [Pedobacter sp. SL55]WAC40118.1 response regulator transcription factor [Pedobacter sp. SL55]
MNNIKIYIADDHQLLIDGLISALSDYAYIEIIGTANNGKKVLNDIFLNKPDVLLLDLNMPQVDGLQVIEKVKATANNVKILVLSNYSANHIIKEVQQKGADGYLLKNGSINDLVAAIRQVANGNLLFENITSAIQKKETAYFMDDFMKEYLLTKREYDILLLMAIGKSSNEIGDKLFISAATVSTHRRNILKKLGLKRTSEIMNLAVSKGWLKDQ